MAGLLAGTVLFAAGAVVGRKNAAKDGAPRPDITLVGRDATVHGTARVRPGERVKPGASVR